MQLSDYFIYVISSKDIEELDRNEMYYIFDTCCMLWEYKDVKSYINNYILILSRYLKNIKWFVLVIKDDYLCNMYTFKYGKHIDNYKLNIPEF